MQTRSILLMLAGVTLVAGAIYLIVILGEEPASPTVSRRRAPTISAPAGRPAIGAPPTKRDFGDKDYLDVKVEDLPKPFQARSEPAKNVELYRGVTTDEMSHRVNNYHIKYRKRQWQDVMAEGPALMAELPENTQIRRILVRASCNAGEVELGHKYMEPLSDRDKSYLEEHCRIYGTRNLKK